MTMLTRASANTLLRRFACATLLLCLPALVRAESNSAKTSAPCPRDCDSLWVVNTRGMSCNVACGCKPVNYNIQALDCGGGSNRVSMEEFAAASEPGVTTVVWVHGNNTNEQLAISDGRKAYELLRRCGDRRPIRFVIWSWSSNRVKLLRPKLDAKIKLGITDTEAPKLARFVDTIPGDCHVSLMGFSFGARVVSGALHMLDGGSLRGRSLACRLNPNRVPMNGVLIAGALNSCDILPGMAHGRAVNVTARLTITFNPGDRLLKQYPKVANSSALGTTGVSIGRFGEESWKVHQTNVSGYVRKRHMLAAYFRNSAVMSILARAGLSDYSGETPIVQKDKKALTASSSSLKTEH